MQILIIHPEARCFAGAETMLIYFLEEFTATGHEVTLALAGGSKLASRVPEGVERASVVDNDVFSPGRLSQQLIELRRQHRAKPFDVVHGWAARDWELTSLSGWLLGRPTVGTLHDHPQAHFISRKRQLLMRWSARWGLKKIICVSHAVRSACLAAGYAKDKLHVIHNGLPDYRTGQSAKPNSTFRLGFLGTFSERKGLRELFAILAELSKRCDIAWEIHLAGGAQDAAGDRLVAEIRLQYSHTSWWPQVHWHGWVEKPVQFLKTLDLLIVPSSEFDPFPTVLLEAGYAGIPVLATRVGGVAEIIEDGHTGWLFDPKSRRHAVEILFQIITKPELCREVGAKASERVRHQFRAGKMVAEYLKLYSTLATNV